MNSWMLQLVVQPGTTASAEYFLFTVFTVLLVGGRISGSFYTSNHGG